MRIVIALPHLTAGGAERTASELANYLVSQGDEVNILLMYKREKFFSLNPKVKIIEPSWRAESVGKLVNVMLILFYIRRSILKSNPDLVFAIGYMAFTLFATIGLETNVVISGRSSPSRVRFPGNRLLNKLYTVSHQILSRRVDGIIAQTSQAADLYKRTYRSPIQIIPNFIRPLKEHVQDRRNQIITVGRCDTEKGHHFLLKAFALLQAPGWSLVIVGDGPKRSELELESIQLGIKERVTFTGFQKDVDYFLSQSKIFAFTSLHEGFPNALLEAMATPLACVSFDCVAGPSDLIADGENGFLVQVGNVEELKQKLQVLIDNEDVRLSIEQKSARSKINYAMVSIGEQYRLFFKQISKT
jgi:GalNAc-alpha-(1->4)-GalNAc-alpha-(1->3)-diNAcBac-PP-undecaprenol alpha-1,4-N-acetyl-D-galactosaminyltransferase